LPFLTSPRTPRKLQAMLQVHPYSTRWTSLHLHVPRLEIRFVPCQINERSTFRMTIIHWWKRDDSIHVNYDFDPNNTKSRLAQAQQHTDRDSRHDSIHSIHISPDQVCYSFQILPISVRGMNMNECDLNHLKYHLRLCRFN
jgi:hypothetical protein